MLRRFPLHFQSIPPSERFPDFDVTLAYSVMPDSFAYGRETGAHGAIDLMAQAGTVVCAAVAGTVATVGWSGYGGWNVSIKSTGTQTKTIYRTYYAHLAGPSPLIMGQRVAAGDVVGYVGATGGAADAKVGSRHTVPHLHFQLLKDASKTWGTRVNPFAELVAVSSPYAGPTDNSRVRTGMRLSAQSPNIVRGAGAGDALLHPPAAGLAAATAALLTRTDNFYHPPAISKRLDYKPRTKG